MQDPVLRRFRRFSLNLSIPTLGLLLAVPSPGLAQGPVGQSVTEIALTPVCPDCEIQFSHVVRLGSTDGKDAMWAVPNDVVRVGEDRLLLVEADDGRLLLYDFDGKILDTYDKRGEGPHEIGGGGRLAKLGPTSVAFTDWANNRFAVIETRTGKIQVSRTVRAEGYMPGQVFPFDESRVIGMDGNASYQGSGMALKVYRFGELKAEIDMSFDSLMNGPIPEPQHYRVVWADENHIWASTEVEYLIHRWGLDGRPEGMFRLQPEWFSGQVRGWLGRPSEPPDPRVSSLWTDAEGRLWVFTLRPSNGYRQAWPDLRSRAREGEVFGSDRPQRHRLWKTNIDVIDPDAGTLIASRTWVSLVSGVLGDGLIWTLWQDEFGVPRVDVWEIGLSEPPNRGGR